MKIMTKSFVVEAALAGLFAAVAVTPVLAHDHGKHAEGDGGPKSEKKAKGKKGGDKTVHCLGVNACKGTSACGVEGKHGCKGHNACKGQGWISLTKKECKAQKGTVQGGKHGDKHGGEAKPGMKEKKAEGKTETAPAPAKK